MTAYRLSFFTVLLFILSQTQVLSSPVLLWSNVNLPRTSVPLSGLSPLNLIANSICKLDNEQIQLRLFAVDDLQLEQFQQNHQVLRDAKNENTKYRFFPNIVSDVSKTFSLLPQSNSMECSHIHFQLTSTKTYEKLDDALNAIQANVDALETDPSKTVVIALIKASSGEKLSRHRRQATTNKSNNAVLRSTDKTCMFYTGKLYWNNANGTKLTGQVYNIAMNSSVCQGNVTEIGQQGFTLLDLVWANQNIPTDLVLMRLTITLGGLYWYLKEATLNNLTYHYFAYGMDSRMDTPPTYSYVCNSAVFVRYDPNTTHGTYNFSDKFYITNLQLQPFHGNGSNFGPPNYCTSFFTSGIWMGITSSLLCLAILLFGVHQMMTIKSNDRFDDPKGKPLLIKAQE